MILISIAYYSLWILNIYFILRNKENKIVSFLTWVLLFILFSSNSAISGDAYKYKIDYEYGAFGKNWVEAGNELLKFVCKSIGLNSYNQYLIVLFGVSSVLIFLGMRKLNGSFHIIFSATMGFIFPAMAVAIRFFLAFSIFVFCLSFLINGQRLKYIIGIIIATTFHRSALFFLLFLLTENVYKNKDNDKYRKKLVYFVGGFAICCAAYALVLRKLPFVSLISSTLLRFLPDANIKVDAYFGTFTRFGFLIMLIVYVANFIFSRYMMNIVRQNNYEESIVRLSSFGYTVNVLLAALLPLTVVNLVFFRLYAVQTFVNCIVFSQIKNKTKPVKKAGVLIISSTELYYFLSVLAWIVPAFFEINSISIYHMITDSFLV